MLLKNGVVKTQAEIAQREKISRIIVTRTMSLLKLSPKIQDYLLSLTNPEQTEFFTEKKLRPIAVTKGQKSQMEKFERLKRRADTTGRIISPNHL